MVSIGNIYAEYKDYDSDNYYIRDKSANALYFHGHLAKEMGLIGEPIRSALTDSETQPGNKWENLQDLYVNLTNGRDTDGIELIKNGGEKQTHRGGTDITFSADKSVSIVYIFGTEEQKAAIDKAFHSAVRDTMDYIESNLVQARVTNNKITERIDTGNMVSMVVQHNISRDRDAQLHAHGVIFNITKRPDGKFRAISNEKLYANRTVYMKIFENQLQMYLSKNADLNAYIDKGYCKIAGVDERLIEEFSSRSKAAEKTLAELDDIVKKMDDYKASAAMDRNSRIEDLTRQFRSILDVSPDVLLYDRPKCKELILLDQRKEKQSCNFDVLVEEWRSRIKAIGISIENIGKDIKQPFVLKNRSPIEDVIKDAFEVIGKNKAVFTKSDVLAVALSLNPNSQLDYKEYEKAILKNKDLIKLSSRDKVGIGRFIFSDSVYTTRQTMDLEKDIVKRMKKGTNDRKAVYTASEHDGILKESHYTFTDAQAKAYKRLLLSKNGIDMIQGAAGSGKSYLMNAVREAFEKKGYSMIALAPTGKAAKELADKSGLKAMTIDSFLLRNPELNKKTYCIVDEAGMVGTSKFSELLDKLRESPESRILFTGDIAQRHAISAGKPFENSITRREHIRVNDIVRQKDDKYLSIVREFVEQRAEKAWNMMIENNMVREYAGDDRVGSQSRLNNDIVKEYLKDPDNNMIVTSTNRQKDILNRLVRQEIIRQGGQISKQKDYTVDMPYGYTAEQLISVSSFKEKDYITANRNISKEFQYGEICRITEIDGINNRVVGVNISSGEIVQLTPKDCYDGITVSREEKRNFGVGDKIMFLKNDNEYNVNNGEIMTISKIEGSMINANIQDNGSVTKEVIIDMNQYNHIDHAYAITFDKSQGATARGVVLNDMSNISNMNMNVAYVGISRGQKGVTVFTNDKEAAKELIMESEVKKSSLDYDNNPDAFKNDINNFVTNNKALNIDNSVSR